MLQTFIFQSLFKRRRGLGDADPDALSEALPKLDKFASILERQLLRAPWVCGERPTVADLTLGAYLVYDRPANIPLGGFPRLRNWWSRLSARPAWVAASVGLATVVGEPWQTGYAE